MSLKHDLYLSRKPLAGFIAIGMAWSTYFAQMPVIKENVGASDGAYGMAVLVSSLGAIAAMWLAPLSQRVFGSNATGLGIICAAIGMVVSGLSGTLFLLVLGMTFAAIGTGVGDVLVNARVSEIEAKSGRSLMNLNHALYSFAYAGAALLTSALRAAEVSTTAIFALLFVALMGLAFAALGDGSEPATADPDHTPIPIPYRLVLVAGLVVMAAFLSEAASEGWSALHIERTLDGTAAQGALGPAMMGLTMGFGRLFGHGLARFMRDTALMLAATLISACGLLIAGLAGSVWMALAGFALAGLGISVVAPLTLALVGRIVPREVRLAAIGRTAVLGYGAFFFGPPLMGLVAQGFGLRTAFVVVAILLATTAIALIPALGRQSTPA